MNIAFIKNKVRDQMYEISAHAHQERQEEKITIHEIEKIILKGVILEIYSNDSRGESCLVVGKILNIPLHVVCGIRGEKLLIVTVYRPRFPVWINYKTRAKEVKSRV